MNNDPNCHLFSGEPLNPIITHSYLWRACLLAMLMILLAGVAGTGTARADERERDRDRPVTRDLTITSASWSSRRDRLRVNGTGTANTTVTVVNAYDDAQVLGSDEISRRRGTWSISDSGPRPVPCRVRAIQSDGSSAERDVDNAPSDCAPKAPGGGNRPPVCAIDTPAGNVSVLAGDSVNFSGTVTDPDGDAVTISWAFPGGTPGSSSAEDPGSVVYGTPGNYTATLNANDGNGGSCAQQSRTITVNPVQQNVCNIAVSPTTLTFGDVTVGQSGSLSTTVSNSGTDACSVSLSGIAGSDFGAAPTTFTVAPNGTQTVSVSYTPGQVGADTDTLVITSNDPDTPTVNVGLSGNGVQQQVQVCNIAVSPTTLAFGDVNVGASGSLSTTVNNSGTAVCNVSINRTGSADFAAAPLSFTVQPGTSTAVSVSYTPTAAGPDAGNLAVGSNDPDTPSVNVSLSGNGVQQQVQCVPADPNGISINSTAQSGCPDGTVPQASQVLNSTTKVLAINDLGMHCGDLDTRIASILPPFQVLLAQVIQQGSSPVLNPAGVEVFYSAASNPNDPALNLVDKDGLNADGTTYKTNFWGFPVPAGTYDPFYPAFNPFNPAQTLTPLAGPPFNVGADTGLPVPNVEDLYIGPDGQVNSGDEFLSAVQHAMPGIAAPYSANDPKRAEEHYLDKPFFVNFPFGYVAGGVDWYEGAGIPFAAFDDNGRENAYPLVRVEARNAGGTTLSTVDTVLPISGEASCVNCHADPADLASITGRISGTTDPTDSLRTNTPELPVAISLDDPDNNLPPRVSLEYAADINILRLHDLKHGASYVTPSPADDGSAIAAACDITQNGGDGDANCLTNRALVQGEPVVCQVCHYTPALDLAQLGPLTGPDGSVANGRVHLQHQSNSNVMHSHHGSLGVFPTIDPPQQQANGSITNQANRLAQLEESCYQCHPGTNVQCLRGAMFNGGMLCSDCHGSMLQVGADFSQDVSPGNPGAFVLGGDFYDPNDPQPRVPWANEPGCGSCHTGDANTNLAGSAGTLVNTVDTLGNTDGIRLRQAYLTGDAKATPIVPGNKRFAEPAVPASFNGFANPGAGNPQLYRVSTGHGGVMCEGCHGATHAEWPNANPDSNDNVTANQLQGHTGTIIECSTCHGTAMNNTNTLNGPHGMHPVGNDTAVNTGSAAGPRVSFVDGGHENIASTATCSVCHGPGSRGSNQGTVLSVAKKDRRLNGQTIPAGTPIGCSICH